MHLLDAQPKTESVPKPGSAKLEDITQDDSINHSKQTIPSSEQQTEPIQSIDNQQTSQESSQTQQHTQQQQEEWYYYNYGWKGPFSLTIFRELYSKRQIDENTLVKSNNMPEEIALKDSALFPHIKDIPSKAEAEEAKNKENARLISEGVSPRWLKYTFAVYLTAKISWLIFGALGFALGPIPLYFIGLLTGAVIAKQINKLDKPRSTKIGLTWFVAIFGLIIFVVLASLVNVK